MQTVTLDDPSVLAPAVVTEAEHDGVWAPARRRLTLGLVMTITLVAFEALAISTVMPVVADDLGGLGLYGWVFSGFFLGNLLGIVIAGQAADRRGTAFPFLVGLVLFTAGLCLGGPGARRWACWSPPGCSRASAPAPSRPSPTPPSAAATRPPCGRGCSRCSPPRGSCPG